MKNKRLFILAIAALATLDAFPAECSSELSHSFKAILVILQSCAIMAAVRIGGIIGGRSGISRIACETVFGLATGFLVLNGLGIETIEGSPARMMALSVVVTVVGTGLTAFLAMKGFNPKPCGKERPAREGEGKKGEFHSSSCMRDLVMVPHLKAESADDAIVKLVRRLREAGKIKDEAAVIDCIRKREQSMPTGLDHGLAVPHGRTNAVVDIVGAVAVVDDPNGIPNYETIDNSPVRIVVLSVSSESQAVSHLHLLAEISRRLRDDDSRQKLLTCTDASGMLDFISE